MFIIKCTDKSFEISASDKKKKQEWLQGKSPVIIVSLCSSSLTLNVIVDSTVHPYLPLVAAIQTCLQLLRLGLPSPHREARLRRRELRQRQQTEEDDLAERMKHLQAANENKQRQLEGMRKVLLPAQPFRPEP